MKNNMEIIKEKEITNITKIGGYYYWNWKFPFRHFKKEEILFATKSGIYKIKL